MRKKIYRLKRPIEKCEADVKKFVGLWKVDVASVVALKITWPNFQKPKIFVNG